jgi:RNA polymerase sigma-70 factor (ECF subfamily)
METDEALYARLLAGDMAAFDQLYLRYERSLFGYVLRQLGDRGEAEDVFHETFMAVLEERRSARELSNFRAWVFQVARHRVHNRIRARTRAQRALRVMAAVEREEGSDAERLAGARELPLALRKAAARLPDPLAEIYALRASGLSYDEIAEALELPLGTVKSRVHSMVTWLRQEMTRWIAR